MILANRQIVGRKLAEKLINYNNHPQAIVLGLPRGGVPVAYEIAKSLNLPLDVCLVRELSLPQNPDIALGAVAEDGFDYKGDKVFLAQNIVRTYGVKAEEIQAIIATSKAELRWQARCYRKYRSMLEISDRIVILVDDGIARGLTTYAAVKTLKQRQPQKIIIATPMALLPAIKILQTEVDDIVCLFTAKDWQAVGLWYQSLKPVTDQEICDLLSQGTQKRLVNSFH